MCLAIPAKVARIEGEKAWVTIGGVEREASLVLTPEAKIGDYVILHAGFAIQILDPKDALETLKLIAEISELS
jgi:hydrogenase expression/formation protein HypC